MRYKKVSAVLNQSAIKSSEPWLTEMQTEKLKSIAAVALAVIYVAGIAGLAIVAPNVLIALDKAVFIKRKLSRKEKIKKTAQVFYYLKKHSYIEFKDRHNSNEISITDSGKKLLLKSSFASLQIPKVKKWDCKWWQVAADIPTKEYRSAANMLRKKLKSMGFFTLQRTLWYYPFDPRKQIELIINYYGIGQFVTVMEVSRMDIDDEQKLKSFFKKIKVL
jgi:DNA-binding transcriptional regulator PaaX